MIQLKDFSIGYGDNSLLSAVNTIFNDSSLTALIGRNGAGKSTLLKAICGLSSLYTGRIQIDNKGLRHLTTMELAKSISFVNTQRPRITNLTCFEVVSLGRSPYTDWIGRISSRDKAIIEGAIKKVGMEEYHDRKITSLSDGEAQRIMIARAIAQDTPVIILDEPTSFLDMPNRYEIVSLLKDLAHKGGKTIIFSTHELDIAVEKSDYIAIIEEKNLYNLKVEEMIESGHIQRLFSTPDNFVDRLLQMILTNR